MWHSGLQTSLLIKLSATETCLVMIFVPVLKAVGDRSSISLVSAINEHTGQFNSLQTLGFLLSMSDSSLRESLPER